MVLQDPVSGLGTPRFDVIAEILMGGYPHHMQPRSSSYLRDTFHTSHAGSSSADASSPVLANPALSVILLGAFLSLILLVLVVILVRCCIKMRQGAQEEKLHLLPKAHHPAVNV